MAAGTYNLQIEQGATFTRTIILYQTVNDVRTPVNLTNCTAKASIKKKYADVSATASFTVTFDADRTSGKLVLSLSSTTTSGIACGESATASASQYVWDLEITWTDGSVGRLLKGTVSVSPEVTTT